MANQVEQRDEHGGTVPFELPDGRVVPVHADVAGYHNFITYQLKGGRIVVAWRKEK